MTFAKEADVKVGTILVADGGFTCLKEGDMRRVLADEHGALYIICSDDPPRTGRHFIDGQLDARHEYIGLTIASPERELEYLRAEVKFWRDNMLASIWSSTIAYEAAQLIGKEDRMVDIRVNRIRPKLILFRDADRAQWDFNCLICGKLLDSDQPLARPFEDEFAHVACAPDADIMPPDPLDHAKVIADAKAALGESR